MQSRMSPRCKWTGSVLLGLASAVPVAWAAEPATPAAEASPYTLTTNLSLVSQYVFRGIGYSQRKPAVQGGVDFAHASGLYAGLWASSLSGKAIQGASAEIDVYGGYTGTAGELTYDIGLLRFNFPGSRYPGTDQGYGTTEAYASLSWKMLKVKAWQDLTDYFGYNSTSMGAGRGRSRGSHYLEANLNIPVVYGAELELHVGRQTVRRYGEYNFSDYRIGLAKDLGSGWRASLSWIGSTADAALYTIDGVDTGASKWVASIVRTF